MIFKSKLLASMKTKSENFTSKPKGKRGNFIGKFLFQIHLDKSQAFSFEYNIKVAYGQNFLKD